MVVDFDRSSLLNLAHMELVNERRGTDYFIIQESIKRLCYICSFEICEFTTSNFLTIFYLNCQGLRSSMTYLNELCMFSGIQILALTEARLQNHGYSLLELGNYRFCLRYRKTHQ